MGLAVRTSPLGGRPRLTLDLAGWIGLVEIALLLAGWLLGSFFWPIAGSLAILFALVAYRSPETAWILVWLATPLSREVTAPGGAAFSMPTEPMMVIALGAWLAREWPWTGFTQGPRSIARPLATLAVLALVSVAASRFPVVGIKAWIVAGLYAAFGYLYFTTTGDGAARVKRWLALGVAASSALALYAAFRVLTNGIGIRVAYGAARPFFTEHGTYAAYLAFFLPPAILESLAHDHRRRSLWAAAAGIILIGLALSFTRAAWLSVVLVVPLSLAAWAAARGAVMRVWLPASIVTVVVVGIVSSGVGERLWGHARSIVSSDNVSNLERLNRWMAAVEMTKAHPWTGVGYGVYPEVYREYRRKAIVTEESFGHFGAHNELLRLLSETGWPGLVAGVWFMAAVLRAGLRSFARDPRSDRGRLALGLTCGIATYAIHGLFNSYLGIDKISVPFWVFVGMIAAIAMVSERDRPPGVADAA
jgi:O-antigen ligase